MGVNLYIKSITCALLLCHNIQTKMYQVDKNSFLYSLVISIALSHGFKIVQIQYNSYFLSLLYSDGSETKSTISAFSELNQLDPLLKITMHLITNEYFSNIVWMFWNISFMNSLHHINPLETGNNITFFECKWSKFSFIRVYSTVIWSERYSFSAIGPTSPKRIQIVSILPALSKAPNVPFFSVLPVKFPMYLAKESHW